MCAIDLNPRVQRRYPNKTIAAHVIGFVTANREGAYGVEQYYEDVLKGRDGKTIGAFNAVRDDWLWFQSGRPIPAVDGATLVLTIQTGIEDVVPPPTAGQ
jgi:stage V sporulation protein D (sporulation-specific penicillin-binding protein)